MVFVSMVWLLTFLKNRDIYRFEPKLPRKLPSVSVIVPAYNEEDVLAGTVESLLNLDYPKDKLEIIVVDDGSTDRTLEVARRFEPEVKVIEKGENRGKAHSLNMGIKIARGELIACLDADSFVEPDSLKKMVGFFEDKNVGCVTPALKVKNPRNLLSKIQYSEYLLNIFLRRVLAFMDAVPVAPGPFSIYRKSVLEEIGGFDENNLTEDMEIALKMHNAGYRIENSTTAEVFTICPEKLKPLYKQRVRWYRGVIENTIKYRHMLFNRKYGNLGVFYLPVNMVAVFLIMILFGVIIYNLGKSLYDTLNYLFLINFDFMTFVKEFSLTPKIDIFLLNFDFMLFISITLLGGYILYQSYRSVDEKVSVKKLGYVSYLFLFPILLMFFWSVSLIYEILRAEKKW
ncbi:MAG: hypothetical protein DRP11_02360 [Candidatus Aenigmatarchaeota archaeon]|nr:MAG: hypothetical protein DRP11_02360 [Candidatus Aenigmarchaeota archaeon]